MLGSCTRHLICGMALTCRTLKKACGLHARQVLPAMYACSWLQSLG